LYIYTMSYIFSIYNIHIYKSSLYIYIDLETTFIYMYIAHELLYRRWYVVSPLSPVGKKKKEQMKKVNALIFQNFGQAGNAPPLDQ
jgi:hypothetical protein